MHKSAGNGVEPSEIIKDYGADIIRDANELLQKASDRADEIESEANDCLLYTSGERVSAGTAVAEIYSDASQAVLRQQLTQLTEQIDLLQRSQNTCLLYTSGRPSCAAT